MHPSTPFLRDPHFWPFSSVVHPCANPDGLQIVFTKPAVNLIEGLVRFQRGNRSSFALSIQLSLHPGSWPSLYNMSIYERSHFPILSLTCLPPGDWISCRSGPFPMFFARWMPISATVSSVHEFVHKHDFGSQPITRSRPSSQVLKCLVKYFTEISANGCIIYGRIPIGSAAFDPSSSFRPSGIHSSWLLYFKPPP